MEAPYHAAIRTFSLSAMCRTGPENDREPLRRRGQGAFARAERLRGGTQRVAGGRVSRLINHGIEGAHRGVRRTRRRNGDGRRRARVRRRGEVPSAENESCRSPAPGANESGDKCIDNTIELE
jgi:hypothetical protein